MNHRLARRATRPLLAALLLAFAACSGGSSQPDNDCTDGIDNDGDGLTDGADPGCELNGTVEAPDPLVRACNDGEDNDGDGLTDFPDDPGCAGPVDESEFNEPVARCRDGVDNDGDGLIDYPNDPGCPVPLANDESDGCPTANCAACGNGVDDDGDGLVDYGEDPGCSIAADNDEFNATATSCGSQVAVVPLPDSGQAMGFAEEDGNNELVSLECGGLGQETVYTIDVTEPTTLLISTDFADTDLDTVVYLRSTCRDSSTELGCSDDSDSLRSSLLVPVTEPGEYFIVVDAHNSSSDGAYRLQVIEFSAPGEECDPDGNDCPPGYVCRPVDDNATVNTCELLSCEDGLDNDFDGLADYPDDPGCTAPEDNDESDSCPDGLDCPQCGNQVDDDGDGLIDFAGGDPGCDSASDGNELDQCIPGLDVLSLIPGGVSGTVSSGGGSLSGSCGGSFGGEDVYGYALNRDLVSLTFSTEGSVADTVLYVRRDDCASAAAEVGCSDQSGSGGGETVTVSDPPQGNYFVIVDADFSSGSYALDVFGRIPGGDPCDPADSSFVCDDGFECAVDTCVPTQCNNGSDDDSDGLSDYPDDPGCASVNDGDESDDCPSGASCPECANDIDDDGDGAIDYPDDPGCEAAGDDSEIDCSEESDPVELISAPVSTGTTAGATNDLTPSCGFSNAPEVTLELLAPGQLVSLEIDTFGSAYDTILAVKTPNCSVADLACNDDSGSLQSALSLSNLAPGPYLIVVDGYNTSSGSFTLNVHGVLQGGEPCDPADIASGLFSCESGFICSVDTCVPAACNNGSDDDGDGLTDFPNDPGCVDPSDDDEIDDCPSGATCPACSNGVDDDGDGAIDLPDDPGCTSAADDDETDECIPGVPVTVLDDAGAMGTTPMSGPGDFVASCAFGSSPEDIYVYSLGTDLSSLTFSTDGSGGDLVLSARYPECGDSAAEIACANFDGASESITIPAPALGNYFVFVDGFFSTAVPYTLSVSGTLPLGQTCDPADTQFVCELGTLCDPVS
ncbi:MAG: PPC domain-containing protein, partial [Myxococcota bacterium]